MGKTKQMGPSSGGTGTLGVLEKRYGASKRLAQEDTKVALEKVRKSKTLTGQPDQNPIEINPVKPGLQGQTYN